MDKLPHESAEIYVNGGLDETLRASSLDVFAALRACFQEPSGDAAISFISEMLAVLQAQLEVCAELMGARTLHPHVRREIRMITEQIRVEYESWMLAETVWLPKDIRGRDLCTRRLAPKVFDDDSVLNVKGYLKLQRIVEWHERTADGALERSGGPKVKPLDDPAYRWEYSAAKRSFEPVSMDFPQLSGGSLEEVEQRAESRLSLEIFRLVRAGRLEEAEDICRRVGQPWRAASLGGGKLGYELSGNGVRGYARKTWRMAASAFATSSNPGVTPHERAVYGILAGVLEPVLAVASSYEDQAWARLSVLLDSSAERVLSGASVDSFKIEDSDILEALVECEHAAEGNDFVSGEVLESIRTIRAYIGIGRSISTQHSSDLLGELARLGQVGLDHGKEWVCRFVAHVCLFLKLGALLPGINERATDMTNFDVAVESYVQYVIRQDLKDEEEANKQGTILPARDLVYDVSARYLSELFSEERIIKTYSGLLYASLKADLCHERAEAKRVGVAPRDVDIRRTICLQKAGQSLPREVLNKLVVAATDLVWESTMPSGHPPESSALDIRSEVSLVDEISETDQMAVRAIEFLIFPAFANYEEALMRVTKGARHFFLRGKPGATRHLLGWFPSDIISQIREGSCLEAVHELDSWRMYMDAVSKHNKWSVYHTSRRPKPISAKVRADAAAKPGEVSYEAQSSAAIQLEKHNREHEEYLRILKQYRDAAVESLRGALHFKGGWMSGSKDGSSQDTQLDLEKSRSALQEIQAVRKIGLPQLAMLLHHVLHESGMYSEAIGLAQIIADDGLRLYENFGPSELGAFLTRIADSTVLFADESTHSGENRRPYKGTLFEEIPDQE